MKNIVMTLFLISAFFCFADQENGEKRNDSKIIIAPELSGNYIIPTGILPEMFSPSWGIELGLHAQHLFFKNSLLLVSFGYDFLSEELEDISSLVTVSLSIFTGYHLVNTAVIRITPSIGCGYLGHIVEQTGYSLFFDPHISLQSEFNVPLIYDFSISLTPRLICFFEQKNIYFYVKVGVGIKRNFYFQQDRKKQAQELPRITIEEDLRVFSPNGDGIKDTISFTLVRENVIPIRGYDMTIIDEEGSEVRITNGTFLPETILKWEGRDNTGNLAPDGTYRMLLALEGEEGYQLKGESDFFILDTTPPKVSLTVSPELFSPDNDGIDDTLIITSDIEELSGISDWSLTIDDAGGKRFKTDEGVGNFPQKVTWNGMSNNGKLVESAEKYILSLVLTDEGGNKAIAYDVIATDILVKKHGRQSKIIISHIYFEPYLNDFNVGKEENVKENITVINRLAEILKKFDSCNIIIEGHAFNEYWNDAKRAEKAEKEIFSPLSQKRADAIKKALTARGINAERITTRGKGSSEPIVPFDDKANNWKNRRVEIILLK